MIEHQVNEIKEEVKIHFELQKKLFRLRGIEIISGYLSQVIGAIMIGSLFVMMLAIGSFALAFFLNEVLDSTYHGFLIVAGFYGLLFLLMFLFRNFLVNVAIRNKVISKLIDIWTETKLEDHE